ncbi:MAG: hypothetical protein N2316_08975 [Spirochaetes bacterium]|nr:hypothetical protein [Spirochaetota bacterium]
MAFGRDGSELEISILDMQVRLMEKALEQIARIRDVSKAPEIAKKALLDAKELGKRLEQ